MEQATGKIRPRINKGAEVQERLNRFLARATTASRRHADRLIQDGRVTVNGRTILDPGTRVSPCRDAVKVDGKRVIRPSTFSYYLVYKPRLFVSTMQDPQGRPCLGDLVANLRGRPVPAGRLDYDAEGLVLCTNDGELINRMLHPRYGVRRVYEVKVDGIADPQVLRKLERGILLDGRRTLPVRVSLIRKGESNSWVRMVLREGRNRQVKRMFEEIGCGVLKLKRVAFGPLRLEGLRPGDVRALRPDEIKMLQHEVEELDNNNPHL